MERIIHFIAGTSWFIIEANYTEKKFFRRVASNTEFKYRARSGRGTLFADRCATLWCKDWCLRSASYIHWLTNA